MKDTKNKFYDFPLMKSYFVSTIKNIDFDESILDFAKLKIIHQFIKDNSDKLSFDFNYDTWFKMIKMKQFNELNSILENCTKIILSNDVDFESFINYSKMNNEELYIRKNIQKISYIDNCIFVYTRPKTTKTNIGCYFIYDISGKLAYIGKSNVNLIMRACSSALDKLSGQFSRIELYETSTHADASIYEIYYITTLNPYINTESKSYDKPTFYLPNLKLTNQILFVKNIDISHINKSKKELKEMGKIKNRITYVKINGHVYRANVTDNDTTYNYDV